MQFHPVDPAYIHSERAREHSRLAIKLAIGFVALLWLIPLLGWGLDLQQFGVRPRQWIGLWPPVVSISTCENISRVSMRTDATCAMWMECSCLPIHCGV